METQTIQLEVEGVDYEFIRLSDGQYYDLWQHSLAISDRHNFDLAYFLYRHEREFSLNFAQVYAALKSLFGESGKFYDDWKGSFSFPFLLHVRKDGQTLDYLLNVLNLRSSLEFSVRKVLQPDEKHFDRDIIHQPFEQEFSGEEIKQFGFGFYGYLRGYFKAVAKRWQEPFVQTTGSNLIVFGYLQGDFFEKHFESSEAYDKFCAEQRLQLKLELSQAEDQAA